ncbi:MAG: glycosyltransferase [Sphingobacteriales bacterium]|nr:glycosyltransferase [Sphingobacteriales bacterium]MBI3717760.1 glycosyltransferase [Sphingobacteriales bacterium]
MIRICTSLAEAGYQVLLVGRKRKQSIPLDKKAFQQKRLNCWFDKGKLFYAEYNVRLFFFLLFTKMDCICAIDLDTILPCYFVSAIKKTKRVYDAHELFCEMKEIITRPGIYKMWKKIEKFTVPKFNFGYTVNHPIAEEFRKMYGMNYEVIRSVPILTNQLQTINHKPQTFILYQGDVNEGRSFETLIPAFKYVNAPFVICGEGNFFSQAKQIAKENGLEEKVIFKGKLKPEELRAFTPTAYIGITFFENNGMSNYLSLGNRFFDYIHGELPQLCVDYPAYREINKQFEVAVLVDNLSVENIAEKLNLLLNDTVLYNRLKANCQAAKKILNWQEEEKRLLAFYKNLLG